MQCVFFNGQYYFFLDGKTCALHVTEGKRVNFKKTLTNLPIPLFFFFFFSLLPNPQSSILSLMRSKSQLGWLYLLKFQAWNLNYGEYSKMDFIHHNKKTHIPFYSNWQLPQFNKIRFMTIRSWKSNFNVNNSNPQKDRIKGREKKTSIQYDKLQFTTKEKKIKPFEKTQIKNLKILA